MAAARGGAVEARLARRVGTAFLRSAQRHLDAPGAGPAAPSAGLLAMLDGLHAMRIAGLEEETAAALDG